MPFEPRDYDEQFQLGKPLEVQAWHPPKTVELVKGSLVFSGQAKDTVRPTLKTFSDFLNLAKASDDEVLDYAKEWGPLNIIGWTNRPLSPGREQCKVWRQRSAIAGAIIEISKNHHAERRGDPEHWLTLGREAFVPLDLIVEGRYLRKPKEADGFLLPKGFSAMTERERIKTREQEGLKIEKWIVEHIVNEWLDEGGVRPVLTLSGKCELTLMVRGLLGALSVQLLELLGRQLIAACSGCHKFYRPARAPRADQEHFCEECVEAKIPIVRAKRRQALGLSKPRRKR